MSSIHVDEWLERLLTSPPFVQVHKDVRVVFELPVSIDKTTRQVKLPRRPLLDPASDRLEEIVGIQLDAKAITETAPLDGRVVIHWKVRHVVVNLIEDGSRDNDFILDLYDDDGDSVDRTLAKLRDSNEPRIYIERAKGPLKGRSILSRDSYNWLKQSAIKPGTEEEAFRLVCKATRQLRRHLRRLHGTQGPLAVSSIGSARHDPAEEVWAAIRELQKANSVQTEKLAAEVQRLEQDNAKLRDEARMYAKRRAEADTKSAQLVAGYEARLVALEKKLIQVEQDQRALQHGTMEEIINRRIQDSISKFKAELKERLCSELAPCFQQLRDQQARAEEEFVMHREKTEVKLREREDECFSMKASIAILKVEREEAKLKLQKMDEQASDAKELATKAAGQATQVELTTKELQVQYHAALAQAQAATSKAEAINSKQQDLTSNIEAIRISAKRTEERCTSCRELILAGHQRNEAYEELLRSCNERMDIFRVESLRLEDVVALVHSLRRELRVPKQKGDEAAGVRKVYDDGDDDGGGGAVPHDRWSGSELTRIESPSEPLWSCSSLDEQEDEARSEPEALQPTSPTHLNPRKECETRLELC